ncbi:PstS family phosphate ABC transporter substrate-binding protein (plasmid) [Agrobacterium tumefaciens]|nr:PstS family phosphate ABC transporter substrate-binding protein [Agrobacterium tumefaciens]CUX67093.1 Protein SphX [Agrobacterium genomosp. 5 str. CFBP 6626]
MTHKTKNFRPARAAFASSAAGILALGVLVAPSFAQQAPTVLIDGSSTVFPISEAMAEEFQKAQAGKTLVTVGSSGTGGGFKKFCRGETDITGASRPIKSDEIELCKQNKIEFIELPVAIDALATIVNPANNWAACMTVAELKKIWEPEAQGKVTNWNQVRGEFPDAKLGLFGAGTDSGTYDYYTFAINGKEHASRGDYTATEDDNITIQGVGGDKNAIGFLGLAYLTENAGKVKAVEIKQADGSCVAPSIETATDGTYQPLTRPLFYYASKKSAEEKEHVREFAKFLFDAKNQEELVSEVGYVALPAEAAGLALKKFEKRVTGSHFAGGSKVGVTVTDLVADAAN